MCSTNNTAYKNTFVVATRIHLGKQSNPPPQSKLESTLSTFISTASNIGASRAVIAVDPVEKIKGYDLVQALKDALKTVQNDNTVIMDCDFLSVSPWGNFVPALNALISYACLTPSVDGSYANTILFISAETTLTKDSMIKLDQYMDLEDTLVVGAALPGHDYVDTNVAGEEEGKVIELNGRTCPWNTLALWNLKKMKLGFPLVADGIHKMDDGSPVPAGIEEFSTVLLHQKMSEENKSKAKLVKVPGIEWEQSFTDEERKKWHEAKMKSKLSRAEMHREVLGGGQGTVIHI